MTSVLAVGQVVQRQVGKPRTTRTERVLWLDRAENFAVTIALGDDKALPETMPAEEIDRLWAAGDLTEATDEYAYLASCDVARHADRLAKNWGAIETLANDEPRCYDRLTRASLLKRNVSMR